MSGVERIVTPQRKYTLGEIVELCTAAVCRKFRVARIRATKRGFVNELTALAAGGVDPLVAEYQLLLRAGESKKSAALRVRQKFGGRSGVMSRSNFYKRLRGGAVSVESGHKWT
jgi:hypothetical protein